MCRKAQIVLGLSAHSRSIPPETKQTIQTVIDVKDQTLETLSRWLTLADTLLTNLLGASLSMASCSTLWLASSLSGTLF